MAEVPDWLDRWKEQLAQSRRAALRRRLERAEAERRKREWAADFVTRATLEGLKREKAEED